VTVVTLPAAEPVESRSIMSVIERAAMNPDVDIDKMERLLQMQERILARQAEAAYNEALAKLQASMPEVRKGGKNDHTHKAYARLEDIQAAIRPLLAEHGFSISFHTVTANHISATAILRHRDGYSDQTTVELPRDAGVGRNAVQAVGSSITYAKRYAVAALLNIQIDGEDDDGKTATRRSSARNPGGGSASEISRQVVEDIRNGDEPGLHMPEPKEDPLWHELIEGLMECSTADEAEQWRQAQWKKGMPIAGKHGTFRKAFKEEVFLPYVASLPPF
jgi:hypothetical protein